MPSLNKYWAAMDNFSFSRIHVNERFYQQYERLLEGETVGLNRSVDVKARADTVGGNEERQPLHMVPVQMGDQRRAAESSRRIPRPSKFGRHGGARERRHRTSARRIGLTQR